MGKSEYIAGELSVGRGIRVGGKTELKGSATVGHDLKVEGWLEAPNIKGWCKGLYPGFDSLKEAYPRPESGWMAYVGDAFPAAIYIVVDGEWRDSGRTGGDPKVDVVKITEELDKLTGEVSDIEVRQNLQDSAIAECNARSDKAKELSEEALAKSEDALTKAEVALTASESTKDALMGIGQKADDAKEHSLRALELAAEANGVASTAKTTAESAMEGSAIAVRISEEAKRVSEGADGKSTEALDNSRDARQMAEEAALTARKAVEKAEGVENGVSEIQSAMLTPVVRSVGVTQTPGNVTVDVGTGVVGDGDVTVKKVVIPEANGYSPGLMSLLHQKRLTDNEAAIDRIDGEVSAHEASIEEIGRWQESAQVAVEQLQQDMVDYTNVMWTHIDDAKKEMTEAHDVLSGEISCKVGYIPCDYMTDKVDCVVIESEATADDVAMCHVVWDRSRRAFVLVSHDASYPHCSGGDCWLKWEGMGDYALKDFSKFILTCGGKCHHFAGGDWKEIADMDAVAEECAEVKNEVVSSLEDRFLGVWDEVDTIKEMLAGVVSNEVPGLLKRLGYDDGDIQEFVWANIHLDLGITLEDLRRSAQLWENWDALKEFDGIAEKAGGFAVMPKCGDGVQVAKFWDDVYRVLYMDSRTGGILYMPFMDYGVNFARFLDVARSVRYISGLHDVKALCAGRDFDLVSESLRGIGRLQNCGVVNLKDCVSLRYIGTVECEQVSDGGFSGLPYVFDFSRVGVSGECVGDRLFYNFSGSPFPVFNEKSLPKATVLPSGLRVSQYNPVTKIPCSKAFMGRRVKDADLTVTRPAQSELFDHCWLEDCVVRVPEETGGHMLYTMHNCSAVGVSELHLPSATALDLRELYGYMRYRSDSDYRWECGRWDVYCPVARDVSAGSGDSSDTANADYKRRVLLWEVGGDDSQGIIVDYTNLWAVPVHDRIENEDELKRSMIESVKSWHDRTGKAAGYVYFSEAQYEWVFNLGIFNELDELFISKNYSVAIN